MKPLDVAVGIVIGALITAVIWQAQDNSRLRRRAEQLESELNSVRRPVAPSSGSWHRPMATSAYRDLRAVTAPTGPQAGSSNAALAEAAEMAAAAPSVAAAPIRDQDPRSAPGLLSFRSIPGGGSRVQIDGSSRTHDWTMVGALIAGTLQLDPSLMRGEFTNATLIPAQANVRIPVRTLKSGKPSMDTLVYQALNLSSYSTIEYHLETLWLTQAPEGANGPWLFDSTGSLVLHGTTNITSFPIVITETGGTLISSGSLSLKLSDYGVKAPEPFFDEVKVSFEWITGRDGS